MSPQRTGGDLKLIPIMSAIQIMMTNDEYRGSITNVIPAAPIMPTKLVPKLKYLKDGLKLGADVRRHIIQDKLSEKYVKRNNIDEICAI